MLTVPDYGLEIVILCNGAPGANVLKLAEQVVDAILADDLEERAPAIAPEEYRDLLGDWWSADTGMLYRLMANEGQLQLSYCGLPVGPEVKKTAEGRFVSRGGAWGCGEAELVLDGERLTVREGGQTDVYRKLSKDGVDMEGFAAAVAGEYTSADAACTAVIARDGERLVLRCSDAYGQVENALTCLGETVAMSGYAFLPEGAVLSFSMVDGRADGFRLNTSRTRNLVFERRPGR
jgi:hypothetical protein